MKRWSPVGATRLFAWTVVLSGMLGACDYTRQKDAIPTAAAPVVGQIPANQPTFTTLENGLFLQDCMPCHRASEAASNGNVTLDSYSGLKGSTGLTGKAALVPGNAADSDVYYQIVAPLMPLGNPGHLTDPTLLPLLKRWIDAGASETAILPAALVDGAGLSGETSDGQGERGHD